MTESMKQLPPSPVTFLFELTRTPAQAGATQRRSIGLGLTPPHPEGCGLISRLVGIHGAIQYPEATTLPYPR